MTLPYAEVIGDPVAHSKSPLIHGFWLKKLGIEGEYRATRVGAKELPAYLETKRRDPFWRGCNVTAPLKGEAVGLIGVPQGLCDFVGAVNCITRTPLSCMVGTNTDLAGIAEALAGVDLSGSKIVLLGAGGAARAALCYAIRRQIACVTVIARNPAKARGLGSIVPAGIEIKEEPLDRVGEAIGGASLIINATPLGMRDRAEMPSAVLEALAGISGETAVFDMVYEPLETDFLAAARAKGAKAIDGLTMLVGQAAPAFELFFGYPAPREHDEELRNLLTT
jgi:shikimate dehydrogenase